MTHLRITGFYATDIISTFFNDILSPASYNDGQQTGSTVI